jgi:hypothetical protein
MQTWPALKKALPTTRLAVLPISASGSTIPASLPPSSSVSRFSEEAAAAMIFLPVAVEPVKEILAISLWLVRVRPRSF